MGSKLLKMSEAYAKARRMCFTLEDISTHYFTSENIEKLSLSLHLSNHLQNHVIIKSNTNIKYSNAYTN